MVTTTLDHMAAGGIYDQLGGGFHRYSTDAIWRVPHFEKMLYDQAQLVLVYLDAYRITHKPRYRQVVEETLAFVSREMRDKDGGFTSTLDADSEGEEGKFYLWTPGQVKAVLGDDAALFEEIYGVTEAGDLEGKSVLHVGVQHASASPRAASLDVRRTWRRRVDAMRTEDAGGARHARSAADRRQGAGKLERPDDRRLCARLPGSGRRRIPADREEAAQFLTRSMMPDGQLSTAIAPAKRRSRPAGGLRLLRLRPAGTGGRDARKAVAGQGADACRSRWRRSSATRRTAASIDDCRPRRATC